MHKSITLWDSFTHFAKQNPDKLFLSIDNQSITYGEIVIRAGNLASNLSEMGLVNGAYALIILPNSPEWYLCFLAVSALGAIPVPLDPHIGLWELESIQHKVEATFCFATPSFRSVDHRANIGGLSLPFEKVIYSGETNTRDLLSLSSLMEECSSPWNVSSSPILMLASTSGSTGNPKIIEVEQGNFLLSQRDMADFLNMNSSDTMLLGMPLYHQGGFGMGVQATLMGATLLYQEKFTPELFLETIARQSVTIVQLTPTVAKLLLSVPTFETYDLSSLRLAYFAGESLSDDLAREFWEKRGIRVVNVVGSTETGTMVAWDSETDADFAPSFLKALPFTQFRLLPVDSKADDEDTLGEVLIHTGAILKSYFRNPEESSLKILVDSDGKKWFRTGDLGREVDNETIEYRGRIKNIIKRGANLIYPDELQEFYSAHPLVKDISIIGTKDLLMGEKIVAYIVPKSMTEPPGRGDILRFSRGNIAAYKIPDEIVILPHIPLKKGKVDVQKLKQSKESIGEIH